jgi:tripartite-type tricarboxylate transporter receptor subunit TctC
LQHGIAAEREEAMAGRATMALAVLAGMLLPGELAAQQEWAPGRSIRLLVPFPAGGTGDVMARGVSSEITKATGQGFVVENRPGGGTVIATELVARSAPDGLTALLMANSFVINAGLRPNLSYNPLKSFDPVCFLSQSPHVLAVNVKSPITTFQQYQAVARAKPGALTLGALAPATAQHIAVEMLKRAAAIDVTMVPFPGGVPAVTNLVGGHIDSAIANYSEVKENLGSSLRPLVVGSSKRLPALPDAPTLDELGLGDVIATSWFGIVVPAGTPPAIVESFAKAAAAALGVEEVKAKLEAAGIVSEPVCGSAFAGILQRQAERYARVIKDSSIKE